MTHFIARPIDNDAERDVVLRVRRMVFVGEQGVPMELEIDEHDATDAIHFIGLADDEPVATGRVVPTSHGLKIGRLAVLKSARKRGFASAMMTAMLNHAHALKAERVFLDAQLQAMQLYERFGFTPEGKVFEDAGLPHRRMVLSISKDHSRSAS